MSNRNLHFERRMSNQDALMWNIEMDPLLRSTITSVSILDRSPDRERFTDRIERASRSVVRLRQLVVPAPYNLAPPEYVIDENFDLGYHLQLATGPGERQVERCARFRRAVRHDRIRPCPPALGDGRP